MKEPALIATLIKKDGTRIMAKEKTAVQEIEKLQEQIEKKKQEALDELEGDRREALKVLKDIEDQIAELSGKKARKVGTRAPKACSICKKQGKTETSHTSRTHAKWLKEQKD